ncbi:cytochrome P450 [Pseudoalteromonas prydzensis]|uniref:Cytochrome P450 n=1 Tax=Pseudoalteromonas prydzensis TaxID=182141 RepID=A0ABR9FSB1_9GAMM|nr:cytochrome P450 [Pseudoalteromonas prydzensis]MBE0459707.1 cytochrome P450 [Pseudoalteromonas prydzensis]
MLFNPFSLEFQCNPESTYRTLHAQGKILKMASFGSNDWIISGYQEVQEGLRNADFYKLDMVAQAAAMAEHHDHQEGWPNLQMVVDNWLFFKEKPEHGESRKLLHSWFTKANIAELSTHIREITCAEKQKLRGRGWFNLVDLAALIPYKLMCRMLGDEAFQTKESFTQAVSLFQIVTPPVSFSQFEKMEIAAQHYVLLIKSRLTQPKPLKPGILAYLQELYQQGDLTLPEVTGAVSMLLSVGQDTTQNLIGNTVYGLFKHPQQLERLRLDPKLMNLAVAEGGRYMPPVSILPRRVLVDTEFNGHSIAKGDNVYLLIGAACRDQSAFKNADEFIIERDEKTKLIYGHGVHLCLGLHLANLMTTIAIEELLSESNLEVDIEAAKFSNTIGIYGFDHLPARF